MAAAANAAEITGAGATFPAPAYAKWADAYQKETGIKVNYQAIGSSGGIRQIDNRTVDFGATDAPLKDDELARKGQVQFPALIGGVVPVVNLRGVAPGALRLTGKVLGDIYLGRVTRWSDPAIRALNPTLALPDATISPIYRSDGSGTTFIFTNYLSKTNEEWRSKLGEGATVAWPLGTGGRGNPGVAGLVGRLPNSIGYVEYAYVQQSRLTHVLVQNAAGQWPAPGTAAFAAAAQGIDWKASSAQMLTHASPPEAWPITGATFILMPRKPERTEQAAQSLKFFQWALQRGGDMAQELGYAALPPSALDSLQARWGEIVGSDGQALFKP
ncbi:phosphate ABC transporter substrate-binding protein PstS [Hydrogenophaga crocea]|nr:phosphate ABC transporter substrate-binding protein PstS [Hydrogenophaga crocea]